MAAAMMAPMASSFFIDGFPTTKTPGSHRFLGFEIMPDSVGVTSRRRDGEQLLVLGAVLGAIIASRDDGEIVIHFIASEDLAELRDEPALGQMAGELLQALEVVGRGVADEVAEG